MGEDGGRVNGAGGRLELSSALALVMAAPTIHQGQRWMVAAACRLRRRPRP
jgi:hypothetical protein